MGCRHERQRYQPRSVGVGGCGKSTVEFNRWLGPTPGRHRPISDQARRDIDDGEDERQMRNGSRPRDTGHGRTVRLRFATRQRGRSDARASAGPQVPRNVDTIDV